MKLVILVAVLMAACRPSNGNTVKAVVTSAPQGIQVSFRRFIDSGVVSLNITTNDTVLISPALYVFEALDAAGQVHRQTVSCATDCRVFFNFASRDTRDST